MILRQYNIFFMQSSDIIIIEIVFVTSYITFGLICGTTELMWLQSQLS